EETSSIPNNTFNEIIEWIKQHTPNDEHMQEIIHDLENDVNSRPGYEIIDGLLMFQGLIEIPDNNELKLLIMTYCHDNPLAGHYGIFKTYDITSRTFHWPGMRGFIKKYVTSCDICQRNKVM